MSCDSFLDWFAGFVAADGCFIIREDRREKSQVFCCGLTIQLRDDDLPVLLEIQERLQMGRITHTTRPSLIKDSHPAYNWQVYRIDDVIRLVGILDRHPIRSKKQRDYEIWRKAALEISAGRGTGSTGPATYDAKYLVYLAKTLRMTRAYSPTDDTEEYGPRGEQLELEWPDGAEALKAVREE